MANHKKHEYLDPAYSVIRKFCEPGGKLDTGIDAVAAITGAHRLTVYRWMLPVDSHGTGGQIPAPRQRILLERAPEVKVRLRPADFFSVARAA